MTTPPLALNQEDYDTVRKILLRWIPNSPVWAFGSRTNGKAWKFSDLDLVIVGSEPVASDIYDKLVEDFDDSDLPIRVDLLDWHQIDDNFKPYILEHHIVLT